MDFKGAKAYILQRLREELPTGLYYHGLHHTQYVCHAATEIAESEGIDGEMLLLLKTAAWYHDAGFIYTYDKHEEAGCQIVQESLPRFGYRTDQIDQICGMIMATMVPQNPTNLLEAILCDADLYYLGTDQFYHIGNTLFLEFRERGILNSEKEWNHLQLRFLQNHQYFTKTAILRQQAQKVRHLQEVKALVESYAA